MSGERRKRRICVVILNEVRICWNSCGQVERVVERCRWACEADFLFECSFCYVVIVQDWSPADSAPFPFPTVIDVSSPQAFKEIFWRTMDQFPTCPCCTPRKKSSSATSSRISMCQCGFGARARVCDQRRNLAGIRRSVVAAARALVKLDWCVRNTCSADKRRALHEPQWKACDAQLRGDLVTACDLPHDFGYWEADFAESSQGERLSHNIDGR